MLTSSRARLGVTAAELLVALTIAGIVLALLAGVAVREQRMFSDLADANSLEAQLREAAAVLAIDLRTLAPASNDVRQASDTALEIRTTIASAVVCDTTATTLILAPAAAGAPRYASFATPIAAGDTAWLLSGADTSDVWLPLAISATGSSAAGKCNALGPQLDSADAATARTTITANRSAVAGPVVGLPLRITRPVRYSLYHASDGLWYLGERDWSTTTQRFNTIQPLAGPFLSAAAGGLAFSYLDRTGAALAMPVANPASIAAVRVDLRGQTARIVRALAAGGAGSTSALRHDSVTVIISARGSPPP